MRHVSTVTGTEIPEEISKVRLELHPLLTIKYAFI